MLGVAVADARCGVNGRDVGVAGCFRIVGNHFIAAHLAGVSRVSPFRAGRLGDDLRICMTERRNIAILIGIPTSLAGVRRIALRRTRRCCHLVRIGMPYFVYVGIRILISADGTKMRGVAFLRTRWGHDDVPKGMPLRRSEVVRITCAAVRAYIDGIALLRTGRCDDLKRLVSMIAYPVRDRICCCRGPHHRSALRRRPFAFPSRAARRGKCRDKPYRQERNCFHKFPQIPPPFISLLSPEVPVTLQAPRRDSAKAISASAGC